MLRRVAAYIGVALAALAVAGNLSGVSGWWESHDKNTICVVMGVFFFGCALALVINDRITENGRFFRVGAHMVEFALLVAAGLVFIGIRIFDPQSSAEPPVIASGDADLEGATGVDLDTGRTLGQNTLGVDLSPTTTGGQLDAMTNGTPRFAIAAPTEGSVLSRCAGVSDAGWTKTLIDAYDLRYGSVLCVLTDQGNLAGLTITHPPSAGEPRIEFDFVTWRTS
ncbi:hypothetical protein GCM10027436_10840 [Actinophytocola sediminis]